MFRRFWQSERGFTLAEVMVTITIMGIFAAVAIPAWGYFVEARQVDSATNQMVSELRLAHTSATNRLANQEVHLTADSATYQIGPSGGTLKTNTLLALEGDDVDSPVVDTTLIIVFEPDGSASATPAPPEGSPITFGIHAPDGSPCHTIELNTVTSRVEVSTNAC